MIKKLKTNTCGNTYFTFSRKACQQQGKRKRKQVGSLLCTRIDKFINKVIEKMFCKI